MELEMAYIEGGLIKSVKQILWPDSWHCKWWWIKPLYNPSVSW